PIPASHATARTLCSSIIVVLPVGCLALVVVRYSAAGAAACSFVFSQLLICARFVASPAAAADQAFAFAPSAPPSSAHFASTSACRLAARSPSPRTAASNSSQDSGSSSGRLWRFFASKAAVRVV